MTKLAPLRMGVMPLHGRPVATPACAEPVMKNQQIVKVFNEIAEFRDLKEENVFRVRAYRRAAQNTDGLARDVAAQFATMIYGVSIARRGWVNKKDVLNAREQGELMAALKSCTAKKAKGVE